MTRPSRALYLTALGALTLILVTGCSTEVSASSTSPGPPATEPPPAPPAARPPPTAPASSLHGIHKIRHVIVIVQENRSFDSYFGTYPGADGIPRENGRFTATVPDPRPHTSVRPSLH